VNVASYRQNQIAAIIDLRICVLKDQGDIANLELAGFSAGSCSCQIAADDQGNISTVLDVSLVDHAQTRKICGGIVRQVVADTKNYVGTICDCGTGQNSDVEPPRAVERECVDQNG